MGWSRPFGGIDASRADEDRNRTRAEHGPRDGCCKQITQRVVSVGAHHEQARPSLADLVEQNLGRRSVRCDHVEPMWRRVGVEEVARQTQDGFGLSTVTMDGDHVDLLAEGQAEQLKRLQRARGLASTAVGHEDALPVR